MEHRQTHGRDLVIVVLLAIVGATAIVATGCGGGSKTTAESKLGPGGGGTKGAGGGGTCPSGKALEEFKHANNVEATYTDDPNTKKTEYKFISLKGENPKNGVPGLIKYCVYPSPAREPTTVELSEELKGKKWSYKKYSSGFAFLRPGGNGTNIPLDGNTHVMGFATWSSLPESQAILLHIADTAVCREVYGPEAPNTCFVVPKKGLICESGDGSKLAAYNPIATDAIDCGSPSWGFEAKSTAELGDAVKVETTGTGGDKLKSLIVDFRSYGCGTSGKWNTGKSNPCVTAPGATFKVPHGITGRVYALGTDGKTLGAQLDEATVDPNIPYRPSADKENCGLTPAEIAEEESQAANEFHSRWLNTKAGKCYFSTGILVKFDFTKNVALPENVVWTVAFDATHTGYNPIGSNSECPAAAGCGYDSLNVATENYSGAPYIGKDLDNNVIWVNLNPKYGEAPPHSSLHEVSGQTGGLRPLGEVITGP